jgi:hypothetical protein
MKIRPVASELSHADKQAHERTDRQTNMTPLIVAFRSFAKAPKNKHFSDTRYFNMGQPMKEKLLDDYVLFTTVR